MQKRRRLPFFSSVSFLPGLDGQKWRKVPLPKSFLDLILGGFGSEIGFGRCRFRSPFSDVDLHGFGMAFGPHLGAFGPLFGARGRQGRQIEKVGFTIVKAMFWRLSLIHI